MRRLFCSALLLAGALGPATAQTSAPALVTPTFLLPYSKNDHVIDYRPAVNAAGTRVVFERQIPLNDKVYSTTTNLYISDLVKPRPVRLIKGFAQTTRPDWCSQYGDTTSDGPIAFSVEVKPKGGSPEARYAKTPGIYMVGPNPPYEPQYLAGDTTWYYPTWYPDCSKLAADSSQALADPQTGKLGPMTVQVKVTSGTTGLSLSGTSIWAGFPSINPVNTALLALAAQQFNSNGYNENLNYVYIANDAGTPPLVKPLDGPTNTYDPQFEGRTPTWSPDGRWIAFESNRACPLPFPDSQRFFAIFLQRSDGSQPAHQVTDCGYDGQHAKWFLHKVNDRDLLIVTLRLNPTYTGKNQLVFGARGIAALDVTPFLQ